MVYHIYIMASASGVLYTGVTSQLESRVAQHKQKLFAGFSAQYNTTNSFILSPSPTFATPSPAKNSSNAGAARKKSF
jgi:predicted GIY-YIG superfamily endonuclease